MPFKVFIVEDFKHMQAAIVDLLDDVGGFEVVAIKETETSATEWLLDNKARWDLAIIDLALSDGTGFNLIQLCRADAPDGTVIVLSDFVSPVIAQRCKDIGADAAFQKADARGFLDYLAGFVRSRTSGSQAAAPAVQPLAVQRDVAETPLAAMPAPPPDAGGKNGHGSA